MRKEKEQRKIEIDVSEYETEYGVDWMKICEDYPILADTEVDDHAHEYYWEYLENDEKTGIVELIPRSKIIITYW